jgi:hypothetical protein
MPTVKRGGVGEGEELVQRINEARGAVDWMSTKEGFITTRELFRQGSELKLTFESAIARVRCSCASCSL